MSLLFALIMPACTDAAETVDECASEIDEVACPDGAWGHWYCDRCGQGWTCWDAEDWSITDVACACITESGERDTAVPACRPTS